MNGNPDQNAVQEIADREANTIAALLVQNPRLQSNIYSTISTPNSARKPMTC